MPEGSLTGLRILIVEDEYYIAMDLERELVEAGATVVGPAPSVVAALELIVHEPRVDAASLDINLGGEMVFPVADELAEREVPYLFATGYNDNDVPDRYRQVAKLFKPIPPGAVAAEITRKIRAA